MGSTGLKIHQFHSGSGVADAVTNSLFFVQSILREIGFQSEIFAQHVDPALKGKILPLKHLSLSSNDLLMIHHSMGHDVLHRLAELRCRKFLIYHSITPPQFFSENEEFYRYSIKGYKQIAELRDIVEAAIAVSPFNARQLEQRGYTDVSIIPLLKDFTADRYAPHSRSLYFDLSPVLRLLFVGRVVRHKCQHELIEFVNRVRAIAGIPLQLVLVGPYDEGSAYKAQLDRLVSSLGLQQMVNFTGRVPDAELFGWFRSASAYVSLSEHEGFGVPLIEAMAFDLPVIAYGSAAVPDTMGAAGITITDKRPASILEQLRRLQEDRAFRRQVI